MILYSLCNVSQLKVNNNSVMCQMSVKLPVVFDQNPPNTFDKIVKNHITTKTLSKLVLVSKCQGHSRNQKLMTWGTKNMSSKKHLSRGSLGNFCDIDADADSDADSSKTICRPPPYGGGGVDIIKLVYICSALSAVLCSSQMKDDR